MTGKREVMKQVDLMLFPNDNSHLWLPYFKFIINQFPKLELSLTVLSDHSWSIFPTCPSLFCQITHDQSSFQLKISWWDLWFWRFHMLFITDGRLISQNNLSWKCPGHVLGQGCVQKSCWQDWMAGHIFCKIWSVTCPPHVLRLIHVSNTLKKQRKREHELTKSSKFAFWQLIWFHCNKNSSQILLLQLQNQYQFQNEKMRSQQKICFTNTTNVLQSILSVPPCACPYIDPV